MYLISLDKKLQRVGIKLSKEEFENLCKQHNLTPEALQQDVQRQLYGKFMELIAKNIPTTVATNEVETQYTVQGYILTERNIKELVQEILEMSQEDRQKYLNEVKEIPIAYAKNSK